MKNLLLYNFGLELDKIDNLDEENYSFYIDYQKFYFLVCSRPLEDLEEIYQISEQQTIGYHHFIKNKFDSLITPYMGKNYCLLKVNGPENNEIDTLDILKDTVTYKNAKSTLLRTDWGGLWSSKVDYLEYQISELGTTHKVARHSFSYYVGLAENAIEYYNLLKPDELTTYISHRRLKYPLYSKDYYNPLYIVVDFKPRDYSSYFKMAFFEGVDVRKELKILIDKNIFTPLEYNLFFARLLYPSYYFDALQEVLENNLDDDNLLKYIEKVDDYEEFLRFVYEQIKPKSSMLKIEWLVGKS